MKTLMMLNTSKHVNSVTRVYNWYVSFAIKIWRTGLIYSHCFERNGNTC